MEVARNQSRGQKGYLLLSVMLLMTLLLIALSIELPRISQQIKRDREEELIHRGQEYSRAVKKFFRKFGRYPLSIEQLENTNNLRFLRKRFKDPMTGKDDWRIVHQGEVVQTLTGNGATTNVNGPPGGGTGPNPGAGTNPGPGGGTDTAANLGLGANPGATPQPAGTGQGPQNSGGFSLGNGPGNSTSPGGPGSAFGGPQPGGGPMIGVASINKDLSIKLRKEKNHYNEWLFYYDPNEEQQQQLGVVSPKNPSALTPGDTSGTTTGGGQPK